MIYIQHRNSINSSLLFTIWKQSSRTRWFSIRIVNCEIVPSTFGTTTGQLLAKKTFHLSLPADRPNDRFRFRYRRPHTFGHKTVNHIFCVDPNRYVTDHTVHLEYDYAVDQLSVQRIRTEIPLNHEALEIYLTPNLIYLWTWNTDKLGVCNVTAGTATLHRIQMLRSLSRWIHEQLRRARRPWRICDVFVDRDVFGVANEIGVELWFFNPKSVPEPRVLKRLKRKMAHL
ncbi:hypothetical protein VTN31DRAFT_2267 [Thermomyces dupontii]|uniref:uncharacterized protein n=1 Tax=Talaromyces thermophilus TaxID=28565 RepID=UPI0037440430